jgi:hypothetical protein
MGEPGVTNHFVTKNLLACKVILQHLAYLSSTNLEQFSPKLPSSWAQSVAQAKTTASSLAKTQVDRRLSGVQYMALTFSIVTML